MVEVFENYRQKLPAKINGENYRQKLINFRQKLPTKITGKIVVNLNQKILNKTK